MNYHSDDWIMAEVKKHYDEALTIFPKNRILGIFYQGSGNYGLDYVGSDVDTKCIILPSLDEICVNKEPVSYTHVRANKEHIDFKDLRKITGDFKKQNINFLEVLFTKYCYVNEDYKDMWQPMFDNAEAIAKYDNYRFIRATAGMSCEKRVALTLDRPAQHEEIVKYGWSTKQLHHLMRLNFFIKRWVAGTSFSDCLYDPRGEELSYMKQYGHSIKTLGQAKEIAESLDAETNKIKEDYIATHSHVIVDETGKMIDKVVVNIVKECLRKEIMG